MKVKITPVKSETNQFTITMTLTQGGLLAIYNALVKHSNQGSSVATDIMDFMKPELKKNGIVIID